MQVLKMPGKQGVLREDASALKGVAAALGKLGQQAAKLGKRSLL
jgi:hypothetical protein